MWIFTIVQLDKRAYSNETSPFYGKKYSDFLTNWNDTIILMYLLYSLLIVATNYGWKSVSEKDEERHTSKIYFIFVHIYLNAT